MNKEECYRSEISRQAKLSTKRQAFESIPDHNLGRYRDNILLKQRKTT